MIKHEPFVQGRIKIKSVGHYLRIRSTLKELGYLPMMLSEDLDELLVRRKMRDSEPCWAYAQSTGRYTVFANKSPVRHAVEFSRTELKARMTKIIKGCTCHPIAQV